MYYKYEFIKHFHFFKIILKSFLRDFKSRFSLSDNLLLMINFQSNCQSWLRSVKREAFQGAVMTAHHLV